MLMMARVGWSFAVRLVRVAIVSVTLSAGVCATAPAETSTQRPSDRATRTKVTNVLFIVVDDLNTALGCYGDPVVKSPHIDRLAARGTRFDRAYCQYPLRNPSRVSFLSGRRPETSGVYVLTTSARTALPDAVMLPQLFRQHGYFTAGAGKVYHSPKVSDPASWDFYTDEATQDPEERAALDARYGGGDGRPSGRVLTTDGSRTRDGVNVRTILRLLGECADTQRPFFLAAGFHKPHLPWTAPEAFYDLYPAARIALPSEPAARDIPAIALQTELSGFPQPDSRVEALRGYYACISFTDAHVGMLLDELDRRQLWTTTVVVLVGDNGFHLGDHGGLWAKLSAFDASTRVPLIIAGAGLPAGRVVSAPVELLDVYPTLAGLCALETPSGLEGESLVPLLRGNATTRTRPARSLVFHYDQARDVDVMGRTLIAADWRYTEWDGGRRGTELYTRTNDPGEYHNRANDSDLGALRSRAAEILRATTLPKAAEANRPRALLPEKKKAR